MNAQLMETLQQHNISITVNRVKNKTTTVTFTKENGASVVLAAGGNIDFFGRGNTRVLDASENSGVDADKVGLVSNDMRSLFIYKKLSNFLDGRDLDYEQTLDELGVLTYTYDEDGVLDQPLIDDIVDFNSSYLDEVSRCMSNFESGQLTGRDYAVLSSLVDYCAADYTYGDNTYDASNNLKNNKAKVDNSFYDMSDMDGKTITEAYIYSKCGSLSSKFVKDGFFAKGGGYVSYFKSESAGDISISLVDKYLMYRDYTVTNMDSMVENGRVDELRTACEENGVSTVSNETLALYSYLHSNENSVNSCDIKAFETGGGTLDNSIYLSDTRYRMTKPPVMSVSESGSFYIKEEGSLTNLDKYSVDMDKYPVLGKCLQDGSFDKIAESVFAKGKTDARFDTLEMACFSYKLKSDESFSENVSDICNAYLRNFQYSVGYDPVTGVDHGSDVQFNPIRFMLETVGTGTRDNMFKIGSLVEPYTLDSYAGVSRLGKTVHEANADKYQACVSAFDNIDANKEHVQNLVNGFGSAVCFANKYLLDVLNKVDSGEIPAEDLGQHQAYMSDELLSMASYDTCTLHQISSCIELFDNNDLYIPASIGEMTCLRSLSQIVHRDVSLNISTFKEIGDSEPTFENVVSDIANDIKKYAKIGKLQCGDVATLKIDLMTARNVLHDKFDTPSDSRFYDLMTTVIDRVGGNGGVSVSHSGKSEAEKETPNTQFDNI